MSMKIEAWRVNTKAFQADILVQNGRIVHAPKVIGAYKRLRFNDLKNWLKKFHSEHTITPIERAPAP